VFECLTTATVAALATSTVTVGTCVLQLPLRTPEVVAKQATAIQLLSGGRFVLGVGSGGHRAEYERTGVDFARRGRLLDQGLARLRRAWESASDPAGDYPQVPSSSPIPVWVGGSSRAAIERAARDGDGWVPVFCPPDEYARGLAQLGEAATRYGRSPEQIVPAAVVMVAVGAGVKPAGLRWLSSLYRLPEKAFERHLLAGEPGAVAEELWRFREAGAAHIVVMVAGQGVTDQFAALADASGLGGGRSLSPAALGPDLEVVRR
jgi:alkanesulfonate monooxygenase SsuD/methylene tetrahydromethanopterin reductase-like flavin-dependent oxidoreductase (luciferase family)